MKKVLVIGCPGSGKSTFARALHAASGLPLHHLDLLYWNADKTTVPRERFLSRLEAVLAGEAWIIDGNYASTLELRLQYCDAVFFLDYPAELCLAGVAARRGQSRTDMPWIEETEDGEFIAFIKAFGETTRPLIAEFLRRHPDKQIVVFHNRDDADRWLRQFSQNH